MDIFDDDNISHIGTSSMDHPCGLTQADRRQHLYCIGKTGTGKSTLLRNLIVQDFAAGRGVALLDPHGDLAKELLDCIPPERNYRVVYFNPADLAHPIGFNVLEQVAPDMRPVVAAGVVSAFKHIWRHSWGARLEHILYNSIAALLDTPGSTLLGVPKLLTNERYRARIVARINDPVVRSFWENEFAGYTKGFLTEAISPILNKVGQFLSSPVIRNIVGQPKSTIDMRFLMDNRRILIANLSKGALGEEQANLLGSLLVTKMQLAAMARSDMLEGERTDFHLVVDEFHNFTTDAFASVLAEARKYRLCLTLSHQYLSQLSPAIRDAVLGNVGSLVIFRIGAEDSIVFAREYHPIAVDELTEMSKFKAWVRLGESVQRSPMFTLPPIDLVHGSRDIVIAQSRRHFTRPREAVEKRIERFMRGR